MKNNSERRSLTHLRAAVAKLNDMVCQTPGLPEAVDTVFNRYLTDVLWPVNFRELEKALDRLAPLLSTITRVCLLSNIESFEDWRDEMPETVRGFLKELQEKYSYIYRVGAHKTVLSADSDIWFSVNIQRFDKHEQQYLGISIVRNDGEHLYFEGPETSIKQLTDLMVGVTESSDTEEE